MLKITETLSAKRNLIIVLFLVFAFLRLFVASDSVLLGADHLKFLEIAKNFPNHTLYNNQLYLLHPPFYPYTIHFFTLIFQDDYPAAVFISLISAVITFFVLYHMFMMLTKNFPLTFLILVFFTLSDSFIISSREALRESFLIMLIISTIYFYIRGIKSEHKISIATATAIGILLAITSDHVIFLIPALILSYIFFNSKKIDIKRLSFPNIAYIIVPVLIISLFYGSWMLVKFYNYSNAEYYPNGYEGMPINTADLGIAQLISPQNFGDYSGTDINSGIISDAKRIVFNLGYMLNLEPFSIPQGLNFSTMKYLLLPRHIAYMLAIYLPLALIALYGLMHVTRNFIKTRQVHDNTGLYALALFLVFAFPVTQKFASPRYIMVSYIFLFYLMSLGIVLLSQKLSQNKFKLQIQPKIMPVAAILLLLIISFWHYNNPNFIFSGKKAFASQNTTDFINANIPKDAGIMAQAGYTVRLIYLTDNRVVGLHHNPDKLPYLIDYYNISYIVAGKFYTGVRGLSRDSVEYVQSNPGKFELIASIREDYSDFFSEEDLASDDMAYIYRVKRENLR